MLLSFHKKRPSHLSQRYIYDIFVKCMEDINNKLISIITPLYNTATYLEKTFASVLNQSYKNFEWIIVDDSSTDNSLEIAKNLSKDKRIKILSLDKNSGAARARNTGLDNASGDYIIFLDSDDEIDETFLEEQIKFIEKGYSIITAGYRRKTPNSVTSFIPPHEITLKMILKGNPLSCLTTMYDYKLFHEERFKEDLERHEDFLFWINLLKKGYKAYGNQKVLATYNLHEGSKNNSKKKLVMPMYRLYRKELGFGVFKSLYFLLSMIRYSKKKYKDAV